MQKLITQEDITIFALNITEYVEEIADLEPIRADELLVLSREMLQEFFSRENQHYITV